MAEERQPWELKDEVLALIVGNSRIRRYNLEGDFGNIAIDACIDRAIATAAARQMGWWAIRALEADCGKDCAAAHFLRDTLTAAGIEPWEPG